MYNFLVSVFFSKTLAPIFAKVAKALNVSAQVCKEYCVSGLMEYGLMYFVILAAIATVLCLSFFLFNWLNVGNLPKYAPKNTPKKDSVLKGKNIIFLGSSVTLGFGSYNKSFVDMIAESTGANCTKYAVNGTTLVNNGPKSYPARLYSDIDPKSPCDLFVLQLSTNDATKGLPLADIKASTEEIVAYVKKTWNCPIVMYTNPAYHSKNYAAMVEMAKSIEGINLVCLWDDAEANKKANKGHTSIVWVHPTMKGYQAWTPIITEALEAVVEGKPVPEREKTEVKTVPTLPWKILAIAVVVVAVLLATLGLSMYNQLTVVKGLKNEGNSAKYAPENIAPAEVQPIKGKKLLWLGSSVFQGFGTADSTSPALIIDARMGTQSTIEVKGGTLLANVNATIGGSMADQKLDASTSYFARLQANHNKTTDPQVDLVLVQLSTNDSKGQCVIGTPTASKDFNSFDGTTTVGALEQIISYADATWGAKTMVITGSVFRDEMTYSGGQKAELYIDMVNQCHALEQKWGDQFVVVDLWNNTEMWNGITAGDQLWRSYMSDAIHPTKKGYLEWWGPYIEEALIKQLG